MKQMSISDYALLLAVLSLITGFIIPGPDDTKFGVMIYSATYFITRAIEKKKG